jgi:hypothetical protein
MKERSGRREKAVEVEGETLCIAVTQQKMNRRGISQPKQTPSRRDAAGHCGAADILSRAILK